MSNEVKEEIKEVAVQLSQKFTDFKAQHEDRYALIEKELLGLASLKRPSLAGYSAHGTAERVQKDALRVFITKGDTSGLSELQSKSMSIGDDPSDGGYAVPEYLDREVESTEKDASAIVRLARTVLTPGPAFKKLVNLHGTASGWVGETDARPETGTPKLASINITVGELYANPKLTQAMLDDAMFDAEMFIGEEITSEFADQLGAALINGDGLNKPTGILSKTVTAEKDDVRAFGSLQSVETVLSGLVDFDDLKNLKSALRAKYRTGAAWVMNDTTASVLSKLKNGAGDYIWSESATAGEPDTLFGYPVEIDENMPDIAASAYPVMFGNFQRGYYIARRTGVRLLRDPYTSKPYVNFYATERVGGDVVNSECIKLLAIKV
ncbi:MAG: phage major capsid protein [Candidatus Oceanisphaera merdipullorum]|nr:phage major capsid protein [Candidatus Oceanisphaera merdipullorum]